MTEVSPFSDFCNLVYIRLYQIQRISLLLDLLCIHGTHHPPLIFSIRSSGVLWYPHWRTTRCSRCGLQHSNLHLASDHPPVSASHYKSQLRGKRRFKKVLAVGSDILRSRHQSRLLPEWRPLSPLQFCHCRPWRTSLHSFNLQTLGSQLIFWGLFCFLGPDIFLVPDLGTLCRTCENLRLIEHYIDSMRRASFLVARRVRPETSFEDPWR